MIDFEFNYFLIRFKHEDHILQVSMRLINRSYFKYIDRVCKHSFSTSLNTFEITQRAFQDLIDQCLTYETKHELIDIMND